MTDQHVRIKHTWSLADKYLENKSIFSYTYDGETFPPLGNCREKNIFHSNGRKPIKIATGQSRKKSLEKSSRVCYFTTRELGQSEDLVELANHVRGIFTHQNRLTLSSGSQKPAGLTRSASLVHRLLNAAILDGGTSQLKPSVPLSHMEIHRLLNATILDGGTFQLKRVPLSHMDNIEHLLPHPPGWTPKDSGSCGSFATWLQENGAKEHDIGGKPPERDSF